MAVGLVSRVVAGGFDAGAASGRAERRPLGVTGAVGVTTGRSLVVRAKDGLVSNVCPRISSPQSEARTITCYYPARGGSHNRTNIIAGIDLKVSERIAID